MQLLLLLFSSSRREKISLGHALFADTPLPPRSHRRSVLQKRNAGKKSTPPAGPHGKTINPNFHVTNRKSQTAKEQNLCKW